MSDTQERKLTWAERDRAERIAKSLFKTPGQEVAIISNHWERSIIGKGKIAKVYATGNFTLEGRDGQWRPDYDGTSAHRTGTRRYSERLEPWSPAIEQEIKQAEEQQDLSKRRDAIMDRLKAMPRGNLDHGVIEAIEKALQ